MKKLLICKSVCPIVRKLQEENEVLKAKLSLAYENAQKRGVRINQLVEGKREDERRIAKARQALFGILDQPKITGGP